MRKKSSSKVRKTPKRTERSLKVMSARKAISENSKAEVALQVEKTKPVTKYEFYQLQKIISARIDTALMSSAAVVKILVDKGILTWEDFKKEEKAMLETQRFVKDSLREAIAHLGDKASAEDIGAFVVEKAKICKVSLDVLDGIFAIRPTNSRIITPSSVSKIIVPGR